VRLSLPALPPHLAPRGAAAPPSRVRSLFRRVSRLCLSGESHYLFTQNLHTTPPREVTLPNVFTTGVDSPDHPDFHHVLAVAGEQGLDADWCREQLAEGATCGVALLREGDGRERPVGMGMLRMQRFWVEEIGHHFDPGARGAYLYALYVSPAFRGRGIQGLLISQRFRTALYQGRRFAYAMVLSTNIPSIKGHLAQGADISARIDCFRVGPLHLASVRRLKPALPIGSFTHAGFPRDAALHLVVRR
jgi:ribosomal protein S18 acetylase RimI-like enzyme